MLSHKDKRKNILTIKDPSFLRRVISGKHKEIMRCLLKQKSIYSPVEVKKEGHLSRCKGTREGLSLHVKTDSYLFLST